MISNFRAREIRFIVAAFGGLEGAAGQLVRADPFMVNSELMNSDELEGKIVLVGRGGLPFVEKARTVAKVGDGL